MDVFEGLSPPRLGEVMGLLLPNGAEAAYGSWDYDEEWSTLLVIAPPSLISFQVRSLDGGSMSPKVLELKRESIPLSRVAKVSVTFVAVTERDEPVRLRESKGVFDAEIALSEDLQPFGREIVLPLRDSDYEGDREKARQAAHRVVESLARFSPDPAPESPGGKVW